MGFSASGSSIIYAKDLEDAKRIATCTNSPKGEWKFVNGKYEIGSIATNMSTVMPLPSDFSWIEDKETREYCEKHFINNKALDMIREGKVLRRYNTGREYPKPKSNPPGIMMLYCPIKEMFYNLVYHPIHTLN